MDEEFITKEGKRMQPYAISDVIKKYAYDINGKALSPHKLRATFGTLMYDETGDVYLVQNLMGHSSPKTTEIYIRGTKNKCSQRAAEIISNFI